MHYEGYCVLFDYLFYVFFSHVMDYVSVFGVRETNVNKDRAIRSYQLDGLFILSDSE